jgi:hypothetical protein
MGRQSVQVVQVIDADAPIQAEPKPSVALVAYLAMYPATCSAERPPASPSASVMLWTSSCSPQRA